MGIRGFEWAIYVDDDGGRWLLRVDADYYADPDRGWEARTSTDDRVWPQGWRPRFVEGLEVSGTTQRSRVGSLAAPLWTGAATSFVVNASGQLPVAVKVIRWWSERKLPSPPPLP